MVLMNYPIVNDPEMDFEHTKQFHRRGICTTGIGEKQLSSGETLVYMKQQREGNEMVNTSLGYKRKCETDIVICGYKVLPQGIFKRFKMPKIKGINQLDREQTKSELLNMINGELKISQVSFW